MDPKEKPFKFVVRLPLELRHQIAEAAQYHRRSMNSEIVTRLEQSFSGLPGEATGEKPDPPLHEAMESIFGRGRTPEEEQLVRAFRRLPESKRRALLELLS